MLNHLKKIKRASDNKIQNHATQAFSGLTDLLLNISFHISKTCLPIFRQMPTQ